MSFITSKKTETVNLVDAGYQWFSFSNLNAFSNERNGDDWCKSISLNCYYYAGGCKCKTALFNDDL
ncbi:hypothetical protein HDU92_006268 [Lobulomyces angularis]|nr:hypothetical protein HDU92_006268 [Lobulomyces angularis]